jgi:hypothetical protein
VELNGLILGTAAQVDGHGLLHVQGGGWEYVAVRHFPWVVAGAAAGMVEFGADEVGSIQVLTLAVRVDDDRAVALGSTVVHGTRQRGAFALPFSFVVDAEVLCVATLSNTAGQVLASVTLPVRHEVPAPPAPPA